MSRKRKNKRRRKMGAGPSNKVNAVSASRVQEFSETQQRLDAAFAAGSDWHHRAPYRIGGIDSGNYEHNPIGIGENSAIRMGSDLADRRQRDNYRNVSLSRRAAHCLRDLIVGRGIHCFSDPLDFTLRELHEMLEATQNTRTKRVNDRIINAIDYGLESDECFLRWADDPELCDREKRRTYWEMQATGILEQVLVGTCLVAWETVERPRGVCPLQLQMYEKEQIDTSRDTGSRSNKSRNQQVINGFVIDELGRELGVYLYYEHPQETITGGRGLQSRFVSKKRYMHLFKPVRPNQYSGFTWFHTHGQPLRDRDMFLESEIRYAVKAAMHVLVAYLAGGDINDVDFATSSTDPVPSKSQRPTLQNGPLAHVVDPTKGEKVELLTTNRPNDKTQNFYDQIDHEIACGGDLSYHYLTGRFGGTTYEGIRGALQSQNISLQPLQDAFGSRFCLPIRRMHQDFAVLNREIKSVTVSQYAKQRRSLRRFDVVSPERILLNLEKETNGTITRLRSGLTTYKKACMQAGEHWLRNIRQRASENLLFDIFGLVMDWSKGQGGQVESSTGAAENREMLDA